MNIFLEALEAFIKVAVPVGALSFGMVWWSLHRGYVQETGGVNALHKEMKSLAKKKKANKKVGTKDASSEDEATAPEQPSQDPKIPSEA